MESWSLTSWQQSKPYLDIDNMQCGSLLLLGARVAVDDSRESHHNAMIPSESSTRQAPTGMASFPIKVGAHYF